MATVFDRFSMTTPIHQLSLISADSINVLLTHPLTGLSAGCLLYRWLTSLSTCLLILTACGSQPTPLPPFDEEATRTFPQTGYTVRGDFLHFYEVYGGFESLGYPLSGEVVIDGWVMQYFEYARLERHPENEPRYRVTVGWLGQLMGRTQPPLPPTAIPSASEARRYFPQTGHTLAGDFLTYFEANGGSVRFGLPISEPFLHAGIITQDLQSARFFWQPLANPPVRLEAIGRLHLSRR